MLIVIILRLGNLGPARGKPFDLGLWLAKELGLRLYTDDGLDVKEMRAKVQEAQRGSYRRVNPEKKIARLMAALDAEFMAPAYKAARKKGPLHPNPVLEERKRRRR